MGCLFLSYNDSLYAFFSCGFKIVVTLSCYPGFPDFSKDFQGVHKTSLGFTIKYRMGFEEVLLDSVFFVLTAL